MKVSNNHLNIKNIYESDIEYFSTPKKSQEIWWFIIKDASKQITNQIFEERIDKNDYKYIYIKMFHDLKDISNQILSDREFNNEDDFYIWIKKICKEALNYRRNADFKEKTIFLEALKKIPTYNREAFRKITEFIWLSPQTVIELYIEEIENKGKFPSLKKILDEFYPQQITREIEFISRQSKKARNKLITSYLPWVKWRVYRYREQEEYNDLLQAANIGLIRAVDKFDILKLNKFKTYAFWWIKQSINRYFENNSRTIRLPAYKHRSINNIKDKYYQFIDEHFYEPTIEELADTCDETEEDIRKELRHIKKPLSIEEIKECEINLIKRKNNPQERNFPFCKCCRTRFKCAMFNNDKIILDRDVPICLDPSIAGLDRLYSLSYSILNKVFFCDMHEKMETLAEKSIIKDKINDVLRYLRPRYSTILKLRYGIDNGKDYTLQEVGDKFNLSRERIRQIEAAAISKLHNPRILNQLDGLIE